MSRELSRLALELRRTGGSGRRWTQSLGSCELDRSTPSSNLLAYPDVEPPGETQGEEELQTRNFLTTPRLRRTRDWRPPISVVIERGACLRTGVSAAGLRGILLVRLQAGDHRSLRYN